MNYIKSIKWNFLTLLLLVSAMGGNAAFGQNSEMQFSLKQAVDYAVLHRTEVLNAVIDEQSAAAQKKEVIGIGLPQINGSFDIADYVKQPTSLLPAEFFGGNPGEYLPVQFGTKYNATAGLSGSQLLFSGDYIVALQSSNTFIDLAAQMTAKTKIDIEVEVSKSYYGVLINAERASLLKDNVDRLEKTLKETEQLYQAGFMEKVNYDRLKVTYNNLSIELSNLIKLLEVGKTMLKFQMGMDLSKPIELTDRLNESISEDLIINSTDMNIENRVEYQLAQSQYEIALKAKKLEQVGYFPSLVLYGSLSTQAQRNEFNFLDRNENWYPIGIVGLRLNVSLFDGFQRKYRIERSQLSILKSENSINQLKNVIELESTSAKINLENSIASINNQLENIELAKSVVETTSKKYAAGTASSMELIEAEGALKEAQTNYFNALYTGIVAKIDYDKAMGQIK